MDEVVIQIEGLGKKYLIGHQRERERYLALRDVLAQAAKRTVRGSLDLVRGRHVFHRQSTEQFWALRDVTLGVNRGDIVGIVGRNGAGKSTLLKILSRITEPSEGRVSIKGRVASLLEVGTGFHPELSGRENIFLNGAILGMRRTEIKRKFDEIVAFAEVEKFLDTPVKRYSSGMYVRLAFAVAAHLDAEILVIDEILAVGDLEFQKRCFGKIDKVAHSGRTVLFVSHNMQAVAALCNRTIVLEKGEVVADSTTPQALAAYASLTAGRGGEQRYILYERDAAIERAEGAITRVEMLDQFGDPISTLTTNAPATFRIHFVTKSNIPRGSIIFQLRSITGPVLVKLETNPGDGSLEMDIGSQFVDCQVENLPLAPGEYLTSFGLAMHGLKLIDWVEDVGALTVIGSEERALQPAPNSSALLAIRHNWRLRVAERNLAN